MKLADIHLYVKCSSRSYKIHTEHGVVSVPCIIYGLIWLIMCVDCGNCLDWYLWSIHFSPSRAEHKKKLLSCGEEWAELFQDQGKNKEYKEAFSPGSTRAHLAQIRWKFLNKQRLSFCTKTSISFVHQRSDPVRLPRDRWWDWDFRGDLCGFVLLWHLLRYGQAPELLWAGLGWALSHLSTHRS